MHVHLDVLAGFVAFGVVAAATPGLRRRIQERAEEVRREMFAKHGVTNIAAELTDPDE